MSVRTPPLLLAALASFVIASATLATPTGPDVGLAIGQTAPDFTLVDQQGEARSLRSLLGRGRLAIVFYRSADW